MLFKGVSFHFNGVHNISVIPYFYLTFLLLTVSLVMRIYQIRFRLFQLFHNNFLTQLK